MESIVLPSGRWTELELVMNAKILTPDDFRALREKWPVLSKAKGKLPAALLDGLTQQLEGIYLKRREVKTGMPMEKFPTAAGSKKHFRNAASWCYDNNIPLDRLVACAEDTIRSTRFPTPAHLQAEFLHDLLPLWLTPEERRQQSTRAAVPIEQVKDFIPAMIDTSIHGLTLNCPGLYDETPEGHR